MGKGSHLKDMKASWQKPEPSGAKGAEATAKPIVKTGVPARTSISVDTAIWEATGDLAFHLNKTVKTWMKQGIVTGVRGGFSASRLTAVALEHFHGLSEKEQLELIKRHYP